LRPPPRSTPFPYTTLFRSWRIGTAVAGILIVALVCVAAHLLFRSPLVTTIAGGLMAVDGHAVVLSRVALLDNFLTLFCLLGVVRSEEHTSELQSRENLVCR